MMESTSHEVELRGAEPEVIELLLEFIYTARISINMSNVQSLLDAANKYLIESGKKMCADFLERQINATNCLGILALADCMGCPELKLKAGNFIHAHFTAVYKMDEFLQMDITQLKYILQHNNPALLGELVFDAAIRWLQYDMPNRKQQVVEVMGCVRLPLIFRTMPYQMALGAIRYYLLPPKYPECLGVVPQWNSQPRPVTCLYRIAVFGGSQPLSCRYFIPKDSQWANIRCPFVRRRDAAAVFWNNVVYIMGGLQSFRIRSMDCYNVLKDSWNSKRGPPTPRDSLAACAVNDKIYVSGGADVGRTALDIFECYNIRTKTWERKSRMMTARCCHGSVEANGLIYVCGGALSKNPFRILNRCEVFDPSTQEWRRLPDMREARMNHGLAVVNNRIYALGGQGYSGGLDSVEYYDIAGNEWHRAAQIPWRGLSIRCGVVGDVIYVLAGIKEVSQLRHVMEYHTDSNRWVVCNVQAFHVATCPICVIDTVWV
ncbi:kelch-like protein 7 isoform X2 [Dunckerocampus dactyliophorus]|nr:kelch-like protein 7 isoform X2 [Dunckerocampus dactyliophorus]